MGGSWLKMVIGIAIFLTFTALLVFLIYKYESPTRARRKISGRGGDFAE
jgi:hypothetical protein